MDYKREIERLADIVVKEGASDLHISAGYRPTIRVTGFLVPVGQDAPLTGKDTEAILSHLLSADQMKAFHERQEMDFSYSYKDKIRFRGNAFVQQGTIGIVMRLVPTRIKTLSELNLPNVLEIFAHKKQGFFLVVGPTGHGKSTTLAALVQMINETRSEHIVTIEDPIEFVYTPDKAFIDQREVRIDTKDFQSALGSMFRQDVNVVLIGEMRNIETMAAAVTAAETGHLVFSTLHTNNAAQTLDRIIDSFPADQQQQIRLQLASSLTGIFSQRLIPRVSGGLVPAYELLVANNAVANLIRDKRTHEINTVIETGMDEGMIDLNRTLAALVKAGEITIENAYNHSLNAKLLEKYL
jgi:twitching motility protein PilT